MSFEDKIAGLIEPTQRCFQKISKKYFFFHLGFALLISVELLLIGLFFSSLIQSFFMGIAIALFFFTLLLYFIVRLYYNEQKPEELRSLVNEYMDSCKKYLPQGTTPSEVHTTLASCASHMIEQLTQTKHSFYAVPEKLFFLSPVVQKCSVQFHWDDVQDVRELFLQTAIEEHINRIKCDPTHLQAHASLASSYLNLALFYRQYLNQKKNRGIIGLSQKKSSELQRRHRIMLERAVEEFQILCHFSPQDPWVHEHLAMTYQALKLPQKEMKEYETLLQLNPDHQDALFRLGVLYFEQGSHALGLTVYKELKQRDLQQAEELIQQYGVYAKR